MKRTLSVLACLTLVAAACGGDDDSTDTTQATTTQAPTTTEATPTTTAPPTTTDAPTTTTTTTAAPSGPETRPAALVTAPLEFSYYFIGDTAGDFDAGAMGFDVNEVTAEWYSTDDGFLVVVYSGLDLDAVGPLCPGNSAQLSSTGLFEFISNAPTPGADCSTFDTLTTDPAVGALVCDGVLSYRTAIPADVVGNLYGTIEKPVDGGVMGLTGVAPSPPGEFPVVDLSILSC